MAIMPEKNKYGEQYCLVISSYWNLAKLLGINLLNTSTCPATIFIFRSATPLLSNLRIPFPYITVKSGNISPSATSHMDPILQCYHAVNLFLYTSENLTHTFPSIAPLPIFAFTSMTDPSPTVFASTTAPTSTTTPFSMTTPSPSFAIESACSPIWHRSEIIQLEPIDIGP
jgi:hypothetical protein